MWDLKKDMMCPHCKEILVNDTEETRFRYEDAACSVRSSWKYVCPNEKCILSQMKSYWNDDGDFWSGDLGYKESNKLFPDGKYAAINSFAKRMEIDVYGKGLKNKIRLSPWWTLKWLQPIINFKYKGDEMGNVLSRTWKLQFLSKRNEDEHYSTYYTLPISLCFRLMKSQHNRIKDYKKDKRQYNLFEIYRWYNMGTEYTWERKFPKWVFRKFYGKYLNWSKNSKDFFEHLRRVNDVTEAFYTFWENKLPPEIDILSEMIKGKCEGEYLKQKIRERKLERIIK